MNVTRELVQFAHELQFSDVPSSVVERLKQSTLNVCGTALGGVRTAPAKVWLDYAQMMGGSDTCALWGTRKRASLPTAAFVNGQNAHILDFDEGYCGPFMYASHPQPAIVPALLTTGEMQHASGEKYLAAFAAALEVTLRIARSVYPGWEKLWAVHGKGATQTLGCSIAAGRLLDLNGEQLLNGFGLAGETAPLPSMSKWMKDIVNKPVSWSRNQIGWAAETGVRAAWFASRGAAGCRTLLEGDAGFFRMIGSTSFDASVVTAGLGSEWLILTPHHYFKRFPIGGTVLSALDAVDALVTQHKLTPVQITSIEVFTEARLVEFGFGSGVSGNPLSTYDGQYSAPHCIACIVARREPGPAWVSPEAFANPGLKAVAARVRLIPDETAKKHFEKDEWYARVVIKTVDGRALEHVQTVQRGHESNPFSRDELEYKFKSLAAHSLGAKAVDDMLKSINDLEKVKEINQLTELMVTAED